MSILSKTWNAFKWSEGSAELFIALGLSIVGGLAVWDVLENKNS